MKLLSLNLDFNQNNIDEFLNLILNEDPDIVCIQEMTNALDQNVHKQFRKKERLDKEIDVMYRFKFFGPNYETYPYELNGKKIDLGGLTQFGNYTLSKFRFLSTEHIVLYRNYEQMKDWTNWNVDRHPSGIQKVKLNINGKRMNIFNNHGVPTKDRAGDERTINECNKILELAKEDDIPCIITGDFNLTPETESIKILMNEYKELVTSNNLKVTLPERNIICDYVFVSKEINVIDFRVIETDISDHYPMVLEFEL